MDGVVVRKLYEVERYHRKLAKILDGQFSVEKEQIQGEIAALQEQLQAVRGQIRELGFVGSVSKEFLDRHSELKGRIDALKLQNEAYLTLLDLQDARKKADNMLKSAITSILADIEHDANAKMKEFNDILFTRTPARLRGCISTTATATRLKHRTTQEPGRTTRA